MSNLVMPSYHVEYIPAHKYLGVYKESETKNGKIWPAHDCDLFTGVVTSFESELVHPIVTAHTAGWSWKGGNKNYFYGLGVECEYDGIIPEVLGYQILRPVKKLV